MCQKITPKNALLQQIIIVPIDDIMFNNNTSTNISSTNYLIYWNTRDSHTCAMFLLLMIMYGNAATWLHAPSHYSNRNNISLKGKSKTDR